MASKDPKLWCGLDVPHKWSYNRFSFYRDYGSSASLIDGYVFLKCWCSVCKAEQDHQWNGCKCLACGGINYDETAHQWRGCQCTNCNNLRDSNHDWQGCKCKICGRSRNFEHHLVGCHYNICNNDIHSLNNCICRRCGYADHRWNKVKERVELIHKSDRDYPGIFIVNISSCCTTCNIFKEDECREQAIICTECNGLGTVKTE